MLDIGLPDMEGHDVLRELRQWSQVPVIMLTARDSVADRVVGLDVVLAFAGDQTGSDQRGNRDLPPRGIDHRTSSSQLVAAAARWPRAGAGRSPCG